MTSSTDTRLSNCSTEPKLNTSITAYSISKILILQMLLNSFLLCKHDDSHQTDSLKRYPQQS